MSSVRLIEEVDGQAADFYAGFEEEPEISFVRTGRVAHGLRAWEGYFSQVLAALKPGPDGTWPGLTLACHLHSGWYDGQPFRLADPALFAAQLAAPDTAGMDPVTARFCQALCSFVQAAITQKQPLHLQYY